MELITSSIFLGPLNEPWDIATKGEESMVNTVERPYEASLRDRDDDDNNIRNVILNMTQDRSSCVCVCFFVLQSQAGLLGCLYQNIGTIQESTLNSWCTQSALSLCFISFKFYPEKSTFNLRTLFTCCDNHWLLSVKLWLTGTVS